MSKRPFLHVKKRTLLAVAGCVWLLAGINVARLGILSYEKIPQIKAVHILLSLAVFCAIGLMFFKMSIKHSKRIKGYREEFRPVWYFFDLKSYIIMAVMMGGGDLASLVRACAGYLYRRVLYRSWLCACSGRSIVRDPVSAVSGGTRCIDTNRVRCGFIRIALGFLFS